MMSYRVLIYYFLIVIITFLELVLGYFEVCDQNYKIRADETGSISSPNYPMYGYAPGSSCRYYITAPPGYTIILNCTFSISKNMETGKCIDFFTISSEGNKSLIGAEYYCGIGSISETSLLNYIAFAYISTTTTSSGYFTCNVRTYQPPCDCGWSINTRIIGGIEAAINEFPHMTGIVYLPSSIVVCGGSIIHYRYILSVAHCARAYNNPSQVSALVGDHDYTIGTETPYTALYKAEQWIVHENYDSTTENNDIALLRTTEDIQYSRGVGPICLPFIFSDQSFENVAVDVAGWGTTSYGGRISTILLKVTLVVFANSYCIDYYSMDNNKVCTYAPGKDTCQYDSGSTIIYRGFRNYAVGIVSFGEECGTEPSVSTRVTSYLSWIQKKTGVAFCQK